MADVPTEPAIVTNQSAPDPMAALADLVNDDGTIVLQSKSGGLESVAAHEVHSALKSGEYSLANPVDVTKMRDEAKYGGTGQQLLTGLEGAASSATFGGSTALERGLGVNPEDISKREKTNPISHTAGEIGGLIASNFIPGYGEYNDAQEALKAARFGAKEAQAALKAGTITEDVAKEVMATEASAKAAAAHAINSLSSQSVMSGLGERAATAAGIANPTARGAIKSAIEMGILQSGNEISHMFENDPDQTIGTAAADIGLAALIGAPIGAASGKFSDLLDNSKLGSKISQGIEDFRTRFKEHIENPNPVGAMTDELKPYVEMNEEGLDVYGQGGLKAKAIEHLMPKELSEPMSAQAENLVGRARALSQNMQQNPDLFPTYSKAGFNRDLRVLSDSLSSPESPSEIFNAVQDFKQRLDDLLPKRGEIPGPADREFIKEARNMRSAFKTALEDEAVWGKSAKVQTDINKAFSEYLPALKDFKSKFTTKIGGEPQIDPGKIQTYINQTGKTGQVVKREMLGNFIEASEKFRDAVNKTYERIGSEQSIGTQPLAFTKSTLDELTPGAKLADTVVKHGLANLIGKGTGAVVGGTVGHGWLGAILGEQILGPFFKSILPGMVKPLLEKEASASGFHAAAQLGKAVLNGETLLNKGMKNLFKAGSEVIPSSMLPDDRKREKLDKILEAYRENPEKMLDLGGPLNHYMPQHNMGIGTYAQNSVNYLSSLKPTMPKQNPLDAELKPSKMAEGAYKNALNIAEQPLLVLKKIKEGTLTAQDVQHLKTLYPGLYSRLGQKLSENITEAVSHEKVIPYETRLGMAVFLGQPLDSTMTPQAIQSTQMTFIPAMAPPQQAQPKHSMTSLSKMPKMAMTSGQASEASHLK